MKHTFRLEVPRMVGKLLGTLSSSEALSKYQTIFMISLVLNPIAVENLPSSCHAYRPDIIHTYINMTLAYQHLAQFSLCIILACYI